MTYGWTILIIAVAMVMLWQWGVFNPSANVRETYLGFWGVVPIDFKYESDGDIEVAFKNDVIDGDINITDINISYARNSYLASSDPNWLNEDREINSGYVKAFSFPQTTTDLPKGNPGMSYTIYMIISYNDSRVENTTFSSSGTIQGNMRQSS